MNKNNKTMKTKRIDFDIDLARKIQAGEVPGRIVTRDGLPARIICWDAKAKIQPIVALFGKEDYPCLYNVQGVSDFYNERAYDLFLEVPDDTPNFQPFDRVLVRDDHTKEPEEWRCSLYSHYSDEYGGHMCADGVYHDFCIPYEGNEHLVGTTDEPKEGGEQ